MKPMSIFLKELWENYQFKWLRMSMSYHKFSSMEYLFNGDLKRKLIPVEGIEDYTWANRLYNCNHSKIINDLCMYGGNFRRIMVMHGAGYSYIAHEFPVYIKSILQFLMI